LLDVPLVAALDVPFSTSSEHPRRMEEAPAATASKGVVRRYVMRNFVRVLRGARKKRQAVGAPWWRS
jgi:hypothetical protein